MKVDDTVTHQSFNEYRKRIGLPPLEFEDWARRREDTGTHENKTKEFLQSSLPAKPAAV